MAIYWQDKDKIAEGALYVSIELDRSLKNSHTDHRAKLMAKKSF